MASILLYKAVFEMMIAHTPPFDSSMLWFLSDRAQRKFLSSLYSILVCADLFILVLVDVAVVLLIYIELLLMVLVVFLLDCLKILGLIT